MLPLRVSRTKCLYGTFVNRTRLHRKGLLSATNAHPTCWYSQSRYLMKSLLLTLFLIGPAAFFGQSPINTVQALNTNNTSAVRQIGSNEEVGNVSKLPIRSLLYPGA